MKQFLDNKLTDYVTVRFFITPLVHITKRYFLIVQLYSFNHDFTLLQC